MIYMILVFCCHLYFSVSSILHQLDPQQLVSGYQACLKTVAWLPSEQLSCCLNPNYVTSITGDERCFKVTVVAMQDGVGKQVDT